MRSGFLYAGYGVVWLVLGVYLFTMGRRQAGLKRDLERLEREIGRESSNRRRGMESPVNLQGVQPRAAPGPR